jgi:hypothetical protein
MHAGIRVPFDIEPSYNIAPMTYQPVVRLNRDTGERELVASMPQPRPVITIHQKGRDPRGLQSRCLRGSNQLFPRNRRKFDRCLCLITWVTINP